MSINDATVTISMLSTCLHFSKINRNGESSFSEPDDTLDAYIDFLDIISCDWINDDYLFELIDNVFHRKKGTESEEDEGEEVTCNDEEFKDWTDDMGGRYCTYTKGSWNANVTDMCDTCPYKED